MSRIRTVKPDLFRHEDLFDAELASGLPLRLAFIGLFTVADCEGRFQWKPRTLKLDVLPHDNVDFSAVLSALESGGFIKSYMVDGRRYGYIPSFGKHQQISAREMERGSALPPPPQTQSSTEQVPVHAQSSTEQVPEHVESSTERVPESQEEEGKRNRKGREEEGEGEREEERKDARTRKTPSPSSVIPKDWQPSQPALDILSQTGIDEAFARSCIPEFRLYWTERGEKRPGWDASFVNSVKRSWDKRPQTRASPQSKAEQLHANNQRAIAEWLAQSMPDKTVIDGEASHVAH